MKKARIIFYVMVSFVMEACSVGPDYQRQDPTVPIAFNFLEKGIATGRSGENEFSAAWWKRLKDPALNSLMDRALKGNFDLKIAEARVRKARALSLVSASKHFPEGNFFGSYQRIRRTESGFAGQLSQNDGLAASGTPHGSGRQMDLFLLGFDASWEIDIFGGTQREREASQANLAASQDALRGALVTLQGEIARNYMEYRARQLRVGIARQEVRIRQENFEIIEARAAAGLISNLDLARAQGELASSKSRVFFLENFLLAALHRLGILLGLEPTSLARDLSAPGKLPRVPGNVPAGMPSHLLRRRPDIRKAERELAAATALIGVSTAELFPKFSLSGSLGYQSDDFDDIHREKSNFGALGPAFHWPILNFKRILANIEASKAVREEMLARYEKTVLLSLEEVENALVNLSREKRRTDNLAEAVRCNDLAAQLALEQYQAGKQSYLTVIDARSALYISQDEFVQSKQNRVMAFVTLYKALGGGWLENYEEKEMAPEGQ